MSSGSKRTRTGAEFLDDALGTIQQSQANRRLRWEAMAEASGRSDRIDEEQTQALTIIVTEIQVRLVAGMDASDEASIDADAFEDTNLQ
jgi:hypothetical protein